MIYSIIDIDLISLPADLLKVHKVTVATTIACILFILPTSCFTEVSNRREVQYDFFF